MMAHEAEPLLLQIEFLVLGIWGVPSRWALCPLVCLSQMNALFFPSERTSISNLKVQQRRKKISLELDWSVIC